MSSRAAVALYLALAFSAAAAHAASPVDKSSDTRVLFQRGMDAYARGDLSAALDAFKEVLRLEPDDPGALAAVHRMESEASSVPPERRPAPERKRRRPIAQAIEHYFFVSVPRWLDLSSSSGAAPGPPAR